MLLQIPFAAGAYTFVHEISICVVHLASVRVRLWRMELALHGADHSCWAGIHAPLRATAHWCVLHGARSLAYLHRRCGACLLARAVGYRERNSVIA